MRKVLFFLVLVLVALTLASCYDSDEIDDRTYVLTVGIDKGVVNKWRLIVQFPTMKGQAPGGAGEGMGKSDSGKSPEGVERGEQEGYMWVSIDAPSFYTGLNMLNMAVPRRLNFMHVKYIVISKEMAESGRIGEFLAPLVRYRQIRRSVRLIVGNDTTALDFIKANRPVIGTTLSKTMDSLIEVQRDTCFIPDVSLFDFYNGMKSPNEQATAILGCVNKFNHFDKSSLSGGDYYAGALPRIGGSQIELFGTALFNGDRMVGMLTGQETRYMKMAIGNYTRAFFTIKDPRRPELIIPLDVKEKKKPSVKVSFKGDKPSVDLKIFLEGDLLAIQSRINYEEPDLKPVVEKAFEAHVKSELEKVIKKCQELNTDVFNFGQHAITNLGKFKTIQEWDSYEWHKHFGRVKVSVDVEFVIRRTGNMLRSAPIISSEGKE